MPECAVQKGTEEAPVAEEDINAVVVPLILSSPVLLSLPQTETVWLHLNVRFECVFNLRRQEQIYGLTVCFRYLGRSHSHS